MMIVIIGMIICSITVLFCYSACVVASECDEMENSK